MIKLEKDFQGVLTKWLKTNGWNHVCELKISSGNTVPFSKFEEQQLPSLWKAKHKILPFKFSDLVSTLKPFDYACFSGIKAYVGIMFQIPKNQKEFYFIDIDEVLKIKKSGAKSITKKDCERVGIRFTFDKN